MSPTYPTKLALAKLIIMIYNNNLLDINILFVLLIILNKNILLKRKYFMIDFLELLKSDKRNLPNKFTIALGELIRKARIEANMSQKDLAWRAYFNQASISQIETGKRSVTAEEIVYLSIALNKPISYFFSGVQTLQINSCDLTILEEELLFEARKLEINDLRRIIAQIRSLIDLNRLI